MFPLIQETQEGFGRIAEIVRNFLYLEQRVGAGEAQEYNLNDILAGIVNCAQAELSDDIRMTLEPAPFPLPVMGMLTMLNIVFVNLLRNALEAVGAHGEVLIRTGRDAARVYCELCDSGSGIKVEDYPHIFDPFFTTKADATHLGLGLTIAESFVHAHGGTIEITPFEGGGTRVRVFFSDAG
ncbi:MAG: hypothetical protein HXX11_21690 [Desulfuromonadales bacterium]|nr:hypothetical protein [Desulfuromonadales bacterium]